MTSDLFKNNASLKSYKRSFEKGVSDVMNFVGANPKQDVQLLSVRSTVQSSKTEIQKTKKTQVSFSVNNKANNGHIAIALYEYKASKYFKIYFIFTNLFIVCVFYAQGMTKKFPLQRATL